MTRHLLPAALFSLLLLGTAEENARTYTYQEPIDALSAELSDGADPLEVRGWDGHQWSAWFALEIENEQDPSLTESNLILFPRPVISLEIHGGSPLALHPIRLSQEGHLETAATRPLSRPRILSRRAWGAAPSLLYADAPPPTEAPTGDNGDNGSPAPSQRVKDCLDAQKNHPEEFKSVHKQTHDAEGKRYRWALEYSPSVELLVVHHTALQVKGDERPPMERVQALYQYHSKNRGWGDIGYHYLIDEEGQIYEGRQGGPLVVGGHAYCHNVGTVGVALLGNFEVEKPTQAQVRSLQWLLLDLSEDYDIEPDSTVRFHGKNLPALVGHKGLLSTECPGYYLDGVLSQVRTHVAAGTPDSAVRFPPAPKKRDWDNTNNVEERRAKRISQPDQPLVREGISPVGSLSMQARPGSQVLVSLRYQAGDKSVRKGAIVGSVTRSDLGIGLWQEAEGTFQRIRGDIKLPSTVPARGSALLKLKVQLPTQSGQYTLDIGGWHYVFDLSGRRQRSPQTAPTPMKSSQSSVRSVTSRSMRSSSSSSLTQSATIRIRLGYGGTDARLRVPSQARINGTSAEGEIVLESDGTSCVARSGSQPLGKGTMRIDPRGGSITVESWQKVANRFRGIIECRVMDGTLVLINELPLEDYLWGLAEEPDSEPYEKQRAFAIAARTYAAYYLDPTHRKFPNLPYDGSDSPAQFQAYGGLAFEEANPRWVEAVDATKDLVLTVDEQVIRAPYFSADDGRTRSPDEAGWKNFPFAEIFASKPDPWCSGETMRGHGVGMSGCGSEGQANEGKSAEEILGYYYPGTIIIPLR